MEPLKKHTILIVDFSSYQESIVEMFKNEGYQIELSDSAYEAMAKLKAYDFDLVVSEVELPGDNAFDLYNYINLHYPYIPMIMTTDKNIDTFFDKIFEEGIGNVLCKPIEKDEFLNLAEKLIKKKNIFGLGNYLDLKTNIKKIRLTNSKQINKAIDIVVNEIKDWDIEIENQMMLTLVIHELTINAVYHSHGLTREKENRIPVTLKEGEHVDLFFAMSNDKFGISINDYNGILSKNKILDSIKKVIDQEQLIDNAAKVGENVLFDISETGRGIDLVRKLSGEYYFIIKENVRTEIIIIFEKKFTNQDNGKNSSLKIIEDYPE